MSSWNITSWNRREQEIITELNCTRIYICVISETKKNGKELCLTRITSLIYICIHRYVGGKIRESK